MSERDRSPRPGSLSDELRPYVDRAEAEAIDALGERLHGERLVPRPRFRAELRAHLAELTERAPAWRPRRLRLLVAAYSGSGLLLLAIAVLGLAGAGPLAA